MRFRRDNEDVNFWDEFFKQATRSLPASDEGIYGTNLLGRPKAESPTRTTGIKMVNPFMRQLTGLTPIEERTVVERELDKLGFEYIQIVPKKIFNDPDLNREMKRRMGELVETKLNSFILTNDLYNKLDSRIEKKKLLKEQLGKIRSQAKEDILDPNRFETPELQNRVARAKFNNFSSDVRNLVAKYYRDRFGKEIGNDYIGALYIKENHPMTN
jgi:tetrahydromethanopterin S-methyltransferase subunit G